MDSLTQCNVALKYLWNAKSNLPLTAEFKEGEVDFAYQTARNAIILAEAHIRGCRSQWAALAQEKRIALEGEAICPDCEGLGCGKYAPNIPCLRCGGRGDVDANTIRPGEDLRLIGAAARAQEKSK